ncbi:MAG TPA: glycosyltransferase family 9 protein [Nitrospiraceae bacterium]|nr:glycosyltransferase family 9 protein [Nitrospiraceae bacterium]
MPASSAKRPESGRAVVIQLARLGDLIQSLPAIAALKGRDVERNLSLLCASPLASVAARFPGIDHVIPWAGAYWHRWAAQAGPIQPRVEEARSYLEGLMPMTYARAYNLNQHPRAVLLSTLIAARVMGPGEKGPLDRGGPPWAAYVRAVATERGQNRVHLADALCGFCGARPLGVSLRLSCPSVSLPEDLSAIGQEEGAWVALIVGAGDCERCVPLIRWSEWIVRFLERHAAGRVVLIGSGNEREGGRAIQDHIPSLVLGRVWDATGRTTLEQLMVILARCQWVVGADTGPLHLGAAMGARALGFYFARARVHETGPYGEGHWVWQAESGTADECPISESVDVVLSDRVSATDSQRWTLWQSHLDQWGAYYTHPGSPNPDQQRERTWQQLHQSEFPQTTHEYV